MRRSDVNRSVYRRNNGSYGAAVFPSPTAGDGKIDGDPSDGAYRCKQCGFLNHTQTTASPGGSEDGNGGVVVDSNNEPQVTNGCAGCGSLNSR